MYRYLPRMYQKDIFTIPYTKLQQQNITCLLFDLDNTLALIKEEKPSVQVMELIKRLKKDFKVFIISNSPKKRVVPFATKLKIDYCAFSLKPLTLSVRKIIKKYDLKTEKIAIIGDQFMTDMALGNKMKIFTILVDPMSLEDLKITNINRFFENKIMKKYQTKNLFEKGKYYE